MQYGGYTQRAAKIQVVLPVTRCVRLNWEASCNHDDEDKAAEELRVRRCTLA